MIEVKNVVKSFDGFRALDGLTMTAPHGAVYGLVGPNGAGKSTIIRHLAGIYRQDSGDVLVDGQPVYENTAVKRRMPSSATTGTISPRAVSGRWQGSMQGCIPPSAGSATKS